MDATPASDVDKNALPQATRPNHRWFKIALGVVTVGYVLIWTALYLWAGGVQNSTGGWFMLAGMVTCVAGCAVLFAVISYHQDTICKRVMFGFGVLGVVLIIPFIVVLHTTYEHSDDDDHLWNNMSKGVYTICATGVLCLSGFVMGCFCCVLSCKQDAPVLCPRPQEVESL